MVVAKTMFSKWDLYKKNQSEFHFEVGCQKRRKKFRQYQNRFSTLTQNRREQQIDPFRVNDPVDFDVSICLRSGFLQSGKHLIQNFFHFAKQVFPRRLFPQNPKQHIHSKMWSSAISSQLLILVTLISLFRDSMAYFVTVRFVLCNFKVLNSNFAFFQKG